MSYVGGTYAERLLAGFVMQFADLRMHTARAVAQPPRRDTRCFAPYLSSD